jgi:hypothetical protein
MNCDFEVLDLSEEPFGRIAETYVICLRTAKVQADQLLATFAPMGAVAVRVLNQHGEEIYRITGIADDVPGTTRHGRFDIPFGLPEAWASEDPASASVRAIATGKTLMWVFL